ncbi:MULTISPECIES: transcriptional regulator LeuO [unclassified Pseudocitrobacter]|uniref:transcriptional regulator LeuO n=1 Tax=unclassified Pseudocitrobacter TaxID=2638778 RepID=UPI0023E3E49A|nr:MULTISPECIES: transcriptional regulator LeuO [unclassified Pseudocitrobacter]MDF3829142.1 transcriptional regulator LeuO [Pseudocitrobacter sp. 2023EL-00150]MEC5373260.1 transcriptional regulator LeuO [Pseudocitrobacter sp. MW920760]
MTVESESVVMKPEQHSGNLHESSKPQLRMVDLNLLTVFDAVMQEQNITRAAHMLGMSQPAVSNAVARLKVMFNDELFVRYGRGIQPTARAFQLFGSVRQALQLVQNELPGSGFEPVSSERVFNLCVCSPLDNYLTSIIFNRVAEIAPNIHLVFKSSLNQNTEHQLRYQEIEFVLGYEEFRRPEFACVPLFNDEMVLVASKKHPRINGPLTEYSVYQEEHAVVALDRYASFSQPWYDTPDRQSRIAYQGMALISVLNVVSQTNLVAIAPRWLAEEFSEKLALQVLPLPMKLNSRTCYLSWHEAAGRDRGHQWMEELLVNVCRHQ